MARKYFTVPFLTFRGRSSAAAPPVSRSDESRIYFDTNTDLLMVSNDGYSYLPLGTGSFAGSQQDTAIMTIATGKSVEVFGYQYAGATSVDGYEWAEIVFETTASVSPSGLTHSVQLWSISSASEIVVHEHTSTSPVKISTPIAVNGLALVEVRHKLVGNTGDGYVGLLGSAQLLLSNRDSILVDPPDNGVLNRSPISIIGADYVPTAADSVILANAISAPITVEMPPAADFEQFYFTIKKIDSSANAVTIYSEDLIDGDGYVLLETENHSITAHSNGTNWFITRDAIAAATSQGPHQASILTKTANYTLTTVDHTVLFDATSGGLTASLPLAASCFDGTIGSIFYIKKIDSSANAITIDASASELIDSALTQTLAAQNESITIQSDGTSWWII